jgi:osmotically inducible protein OsmC
MKRIANAQWSGTGLEGKGSITTPTSGAIKDMPFDFKARFQNEDGTAGTNPEELLAAGHAACFSMALSFQLAGAGFPAQSIATSAHLTMDKDAEGAGWTITKVHLDVKVAAAGISAEAFATATGNAKAGCPVSKLFNCEITMDAVLL